jgi:hypothetical protein
MNWMNELLAHLIGDYLLQSDWMALHKRQSWLAAVAHGVAYGVPFLFVATSVWAWVVVVASHVVIDHFGLARYVVFAKNFLAPRSQWPSWERCKQTGYDQDRPPWLAVWLLIIADNTLHLIINHWALA